MQILLAFLILESFRLMTKSLYISIEMSNFNITEIQIWASFGPVGNNEKKTSPIMSNFGGWFFFVFTGKKKAIAASA